MPRLTTRPRANVTGPRLETSTSGRGSGRVIGLLQQLAEDPQVVAQIARREEVLAHVLLAAAAQLLAERGVAEDVERSGGTVLDASRPGSR